MNSSSSSSTPAVVAGAAGLAAAAAVAVVATQRYRSAAATHPTELTLVIFQDHPSDGLQLNGHHIRFSTGLPFACLQAAVCQALQLPTPPTLFVACAAAGASASSPQPATISTTSGAAAAAAGPSSAWQELRPGTFLEQLSAAAACASCSNPAYLRGVAAVALLATQAGDELSDAAAALPVVLPPPIGARVLPFVRHAHVAFGPYSGPSMYNVWWKLFRPHQLERWGETVLVLAPPMGADRALFEAGHTDDPQVLEATVMTCDPHVVGELLERQADFPKFFNRANETRFAQLAEGGIFTSSTESEDWQTAHGIFPKAFNPLKVAQAYHGVITRQTDAFVGEWGKFPPGHLITGVNMWLAAFTADAVIEASCNLEMGNVARRGRGEPAHPLLELYRQITGMHPAVASPREVVGWANWLNPRFNTAAELARRHAALKGQLQHLVSDLQDQARGSALAGTLLSALVNDASATNGQRVRQRVIFGNFVTLLVAGHETTANTIGFCMLYLSKHPEWEARLRAEAREVLAGRPCLDAADLPRLVVAEACFKEALRLHPAAAAVGRDARADTLLRGRWLVRRGQRVQVNLVALHRNARHWPDPDVFNPGRFLPGVAEAEGRHPHAFKPFGFGVRTCIGMFFALAEAKTLLAMLYNSYTFRLVDGFKIIPSRRESFPTLSAEGLAFHIYPAPGAPAAAGASSLRGGPASLALGKDLAAAAAAAGGSNGVAVGAASAATATVEPGTPVKAAASSLTGGQAVRAAAPAAAAVAANGQAAADDAAQQQHGTRLLVLYGSNSGTCEAMAEQISDAASAAGFAVTLGSLDSAVPPTTGDNSSSLTAALPAGCGLVVVTSTYNGTPPDNAGAFARWLARAAGEGTGARGVSYAVFGVGNSQWAQTFQAFPTLVDQQLAAAGGTRVVPYGSTDAASGALVDELDAWLATWLVPGLLEHFGLAAPPPASRPAADAAEPAGLHVRRPRLLISPALDINGGGGDSSSTAADAAAAAAQMRVVPLAIDDVLDRLEVAVSSLPGGTATFPYRRLRITVAQQLQAPGSGRATRHVEVALPAGMTYAAGSHLEIQPCNSPALVDAALQLLGLTGREAFMWTPNTGATLSGLNLHSSSGGSGAIATAAAAAAQPESSSSSSRSSGEAAVAGAPPVVVMPPLPIESAAVLSWLVDLSAVPPRSTLASLAELCPCPPEAVKLAALASEETYAEQVWAARLSLLEVLSRFRSLLSVLDLSAVCNLLPRLAPRFYSISSSPKAPGGPSRATITVALVEGPTPTGRLHQGAASSGIHAKQVGDYLLGAVRSLQQSRFRLPADAATPLIMVGPGTGVAPLVGFAEEREALQQAGVTLGPAVLFFGCRHPEHDYLYADRLAAWRAAGVLSEVHVAFSRVEGQPKKYVQELILEQGERLWQLLQAGARVYVCGDARAMAPGVRRAFTQVAQAAGGLAPAAAEAWMAGLLQAGRFAEDVWAS